MEFVAGHLLEKGSGERGRRLSSGGFDGEFIDEGWVGLCVVELGRFMGVQGGFRSRGSWGGAAPCKVCRKTEGVYLGVGEEGVVEVEGDALGGEKGACFPGGCAGVCKDVLMSVVDES